VPDASAPSRRVPCGISACVALRPRVGIGLRGRLPERFAQAREPLRGIVLRIGLLHPQQVCA
jgi:hypothetical protein